jgi:hypothetical protein
MRTPSAWGSSLKLHVKINGGSGRTVSAHCYRTMRGLDIYAWVEGYDGRKVCGVAKLSLADLDRYITEVRRVKRARSRHRGRGE